MWIAKAYDGPYFIDFIFCSGNGIGIGDAKWRERAATVLELDSLIVPAEEMIFPYLGATRLSNPLDQLRPMVAFHGHAHRGTLRGATRGGVPVYNVALPMLKRLEKPLGYFTMDL